MRSIYSAIIGVFLFFLLVPTAVHAASITISSGSGELKNNNEYTVQVNLSISAADNTQYYVRGVFAKQGPAAATNYCGFTWNGTAWFNGPYSTNNGWKNFLPVTIINNAWSGQIKAKIDPDDSGCKDSGAYIFKVERFTNSGSGNFDSQNEQIVQISLPSPTPTPTPSPEPTKTPTKSVPSSKNSTQYGITSGVTIIPSIHTTSTQISITPSLSPEISATLSSVLGDEMIASDSPTQIPKKEKTKVEGIARQNFPTYLALGGMILLASCGIVSFQIIKSRMKKKESPQGRQMS